MSTIANEDSKVEKNYECSECGKELPTEHGLSTHKGIVHFDTQPVPYRINKGYEVWGHYYQGEYDTIPVHRLLAIADGASPYDVFSPDTNVHHGPEIEHSRANIPGNLQVMESGEHTRHHELVDDDDLLDELVRLADELGHSPTTKEMTSDGKYSVPPYKNHFGSWNNAKKEAGLNVNNSGSELNDSDLLDELVRLADELGHSPSTRDMVEYGEYSVEVYKNHFGGYNYAKTKAGLETHTDNRSVPDHDTDIPIKYRI